MPWSKKHLIWDSTWTWKNDLCTSLPVPVSPFSFFSILSQQKVWAISPSYISSSPLGVLSRRSRYTYNVLSTFNNSTVTFLRVKNFFITKCVNIMYESWHFVRLNACLAVMMECFLNLLSGTCWSLFLRPLLRSVLCEDGAPPDQQLLLCKSCQDEGWECDISL